MNRAKDSGPSRPHNGSSRRALALLVLLVFVAGSTLATADEVLHSSARSGPAAPSTADSCPDPGTDGQPCGPGCQCFCCPGHANGLAVFPPRTSVEIPPSSEFELEAHDDLRPKGVLRRIFHPPRA